jgi:hypothetical protein
MSQVQVVKIDKSLLRYFSMVMDLDNEHQEFKDIILKEFKQELSEALNCGTAKKEIEWV